MAEKNPIAKRLTDGEGVGAVARAKRGHLLKCALAVFLEYGYSLATMDKVAALAGCSKQTIYGLFKDKSGLFEAVFTELAARVAEQQSLQRSQPENAEQYLTAVANSFFDVMERDEYASFFRLVISESGRFPELARLYVESVVEPSANELENYLQSQTHLAIEDPKAVARAFRGSMASFILVQEILHGKTVIPLTKERFIKSLVQMVVGKS